MNKLKVAATFLTKLERNSLLPVFLKNSWYKNNCESNIDPLRTAFSLVRKNTWSKILLALTVLCSITAVVSLKFNTTSFNELSGAIVFLAITLLATTLLNWQNLLFRLPKDNKEVEVEIYSLYTDLKKLIELEVFRPHSVFENDELTICGNAKNCSTVQAIKILCIERKLSKPPSTPKGRNENLSNKDLSLKKNEAESKLKMMFNTFGRFNLVSNKEDFETFLKAIKPKTKKMIEIRGWESYCPDTSI